MELINIFYKTMCEMHPWPTNFLTMMDGPILNFHRDPKFSNTCASEISYAFNCIDGHHVDTSGDYGKGGVLVKQVRTLKDSDRFEYIFSTLDLRQYLNNQYGSGQQFPNTSKIGSRNGVIIFEPSTTIGHTDVWVDGQIDNPLELLGFARTTKRCCTQSLRRWSSQQPMLSEERRCCARLAQSARTRGRA